MREIRFRAWDKRENTMRDVAVLHFTKGGKVNSIEYWKTPSELKSYHVRNLVLMQYTGLDDKNGLGIFEKDIVKAKTADGFEYVYLVDWYEKAREHALFLRGEAWIRLSVNYEIEVIGNVYEHKYLLE